MMPDAGTGPARWTRGLVLAVLALASAACATGRPAGAGAGRDADLLTAAQMERLGTVSLLQAVQALRPHWLSTRGFDSLQAQGEVVVFRDGMMLGGPSSLNEMQSTTVTSVRHFDGPSATARWGI